MTSPSNVGRSPPVPKFWNSRLILDGLNSTTIAILGNILGKISGRCGRDALTGPENFRLVEDTKAGTRIILRGTDESLNHNRAIMHVWILCLLAGTCA